MYADGETLADELGLTYEGDDATIIDSLIITASNMIDQHCGRNFDGVTGLERKFDYDGSEMLEFGPYILGPNPTVKYVDASGNETTLVEDVDYVLQPRHPILKDGVGEYRHAYLRLVSEYSEGIAVFRITGDWGFANLPKTLERACIITVKHIISLAQLPNDVITSEAGIGRLREFDISKRKAAIPSVADMLLTRGGYTKQRMSASGATYL